MPGWIEPIRYGKDSRSYLGHTFRYYLAKGFLEPTDVVIDASCGVGYGSRILGSACKKVYGYDIDERALKIAREKYALDNTFFYCKDLETIEEFPACDVFVSFETIEHISNAERLAPIVKASAVRLIVMSTPWKDTKSPHHKVPFFTERQLLDMFTDDEWKHWEMVKQSPYTVCVFYRKGTL